MSNIGRFLELDVMQANEIAEGVELAQKYKIPALVVHQDIVSQVQNLKIIRQGKFKIITPVGWPDGDKYGMDKLRMVKADALNADGFEIILANKSHIDQIKQEIKIFSSFIREEIFQLIEVRFSLEVFDRSEEEVKLALEALSGSVKPNMVRNDHSTKAQQKFANNKNHVETINKIKKHTKVDIKISGNISNLKSMAQCDGATRFGVNLKQATSIIKEDLKEPKKFLELCNAAE